MVCNRSSMMFLPNRKGTLRRDNDRRQKIHRIALQSIRGDVDSREPLSKRFSRGVNLKKAHQEEGRMDYAEKCNRKLVDKMMIMQGLGGTITAEQKFPDFNPGTLNRPVRRREILRINRDNLALMHRIEKATSDYKRKLLEPKHFQMPHMGLFPRVSGSVSLAGKSSKDRGERASQRKRKRVQSSPGCSGLGGETSVTSGLTEPSVIHQSRSTVAAGTVGVMSEGKDVEETKESDVPESGDDGAYLITRKTEWTPQPPPTSIRTTCASTSPRTTWSKQTPNKLLIKPLEVRRSEMVYHGGVKVGDDYMVLSVIRCGKNASGLDGDGGKRFRLQVYSPTLLTVYTLEISAKRLPDFTLGNRIAAREMFRPGERSRMLWENVAACLELRPPTSPAPKATGTEWDKQQGKVDANSGMDGWITKIPPKPVLRQTTGGLEGPTPDSVVVASATGNATSNLVLVPPSEAPIVVIQRIFRGIQTRRQYKVLKASTIFIQVTTRLWRERIRRRRHGAASKISALVRGRQARIREQQRIAAARIQILPKNSESPQRYHNSPRGRSSFAPRSTGSVRSSSVGSGRAKKAYHEGHRAKLAGRGTKLSPEKPLTLSNLPEKNEHSSDIRSTADVRLPGGKSHLDSPLAREVMRPRPPDATNPTRSSFCRSRRGRTAGTTVYLRTGSSIGAPPRPVLSSPIASTGLSRPNRNTNKEQKDHPRNFLKPPGKTSNNPLSSSGHAAPDRTRIPNRARHVKATEGSCTALHPTPLAERIPAPGAGRTASVTSVATSDKIGQGEERDADGERCSSAQDSNKNDPLSREGSPEPTAPPSPGQSDSDGQEYMSSEGDGQPDAAAVEQQNPERGAEYPSSSTFCAEARVESEARVQEREVAAATVDEPVSVAELGDAEEGAKASESAEQATKTITAGDQR